jgi:hypothetical protein
MSLEPRKILDGLFSVHGHGCPNFIKPLPQLLSCVQILYTHLIPVFQTTIFKYNILVCYSSILPLCYFPIYVFFFLEPCILIFAVGKVDMGGSSSRSFQNPRPCQLAPVFGLATCSRTIKQLTLRLLHLGPSHNLRCFQWLLYAVSYILSLFAFS